MLGGDLNAYSVALSFYEAYGVTSHAFVRYRCGATENSKFIKTHICSGIDDLSVAIPELLKFAAEHPHRELYLIPCADWYVSMLEAAGGALSAIYEVCIPDRRHFSMLSDKLRFYNFMEQAGIKYPEYESFGPEENISDEKLSRFTYPAVIKPSDSTEYWKNPFPDMKKVYFPKNKSESEAVIKRILDSGYAKRVILQRLIAPARHGVLTTLSTADGRVVRAVRGDVIMQQTGRTSYGNHAAIIIRALDGISYQLIKFLNGISYVGIANIDLISDADVTYALEVNLRQGRSSDYLRSAGVSLAEYLVKFSRGENITPDFSYKEAYWHYPRHSDVRKYSSPADVIRADRLIAEGKAFSPYGNSYDGVKRKIYAVLHSLRLSEALRSDAEYQGGKGNGK